mmetsp:Transcript_36780/g.42777  ORF Transcript_36780/g.42777 Transcript_36780/m.42777 type:complete len:144 (+) Transcript_36780:2-433(+)
MSKKSTKARHKMCCAVGERVLISRCMIVPSFIQSSTYHARNCNDRHVNNESTAEYLQRHLVTNESRAYLTNGDEAVARRQESPVTDDRRRYMSRPTPGQRKEARNASIFTPQRLLQSQQHFRYFFEKYMLQNNFLPSFWIHFC